MIKIYNYNVLGIIALMLTWCITYYYQMGLYDKTKDSIVSTWRVLKERVRIKKVKTKGNENQRDSGLVGVSDAQIKEKLKDPTISKKEKRRLQKEEKARKLRNQRKNRGKNKSKK